MANEELRQWILVAEIFRPGMFNLGLPFDNFVLQIEALRDWGDEVIQTELDRMLSEGLVKTEGRAWYSTYEGQVAREQFLQQNEQRATCLRDQQSHLLDELVLALVMAYYIHEPNGSVQNDNTIRVYLHQHADDCRPASDRLVEAGLVRGIDGLGHHHARGYYPTSKGMRHYERTVLEKLGIDDLQTVLDPPLQLPVGPHTGRYTITSKLGEGVYGDVWRARDTQLERTVAIKFIRATGQAEMGALQHARALANVEHPNIVRVYNVEMVVDPSTGALASAVVMELVEGPTLSEVLHRTLDPSDARRIGTELLGALGEYHEKGIAHSDLHGGNVIVGSTQVKILDPLYLDTSLMASTASRQAQQERDLRSARDLLVQILEVGSSNLSLVADFTRQCRIPALDTLLREFLAALSPGSE